ncbi:Transcription factor bHLH83 [Rhynchospora pubera]|uniref:Transcription factor bHLH83 n=1 Tax=Rhynchospora pubera TaxID=906938 RepID=A0AAV8F4J4_9POAL|nr:Transcription factor bHLH83 [Rhynchospora pubera]
MALNSPPIEPFNYNADHFYDSFLDTGDDLAISSLLASSIDNSSARVNYGSPPNNSTYSSSSSSVLNFNQEDECDLWMDAMDQNSQVSKFQNGVEMLNGCSYINGAIGEKRPGENGRFMFPYPSSSHIDYVQESLKQEKISRKRSLESVELNILKKQCVLERKTKAKSLSPIKDPQSHAAKVDLVTMLEKAISYVKFLQLQVKVLATDEFWPAEGGTAPDISQVKEALDAILSSNKESMSSSSSPEKRNN